MSTSLDRVMATRYVTPLREGGSLPGVVEAEDLGTYVCKFRGAGQGLPVLVAEVVVGELARRLGAAPAATAGAGLRTPRLVVLDLPAELARYEADEEVQDLLKASLGTNLGIDFLPGSFGFDPTRSLAPEMAGAALWLDAFVANVDRTWRNPNLLVWHGEVWLIDHGAALYFHHGWQRGIGDPERFAVQPFDTTHHCLRAYSAVAAELDADLAARVDDAVLGEALALVPDEWLEPRPGASTPEDLRDAYHRFLRARLDGGRPWCPGSTEAAA